MERRHSQPANSGHDDLQAPVRGPEQLEPAERLRNVARAHPLAAFAAVLVAGYVLGRMLRR